MTNTDTPEFVTVHEAASIIAAKPYAIYELCEAGVIASRFEDGRVLVNAASLRTYAAAQESA